MSKTEKAEITVSFLLAEFNTLQERATNLEQVKSTQVNFFLIVVAAIIAGLSGLSSVPTLQTFMLDGIFVASFLVFLLGFATLYQSVNYSMSIVSFYRRAGRIRRWFVDFDKDIAPYVAFPPGDDRPRFKLTRSYLAFRGGDAVLLIINSVSFAGITTSLIASFFYFAPIFIFFVAIIVGVFAWFLQYQIIYRRLSNEEKRNINQIHFPHKAIESQTTIVKNTVVSIDSDTQQTETKKT